METLRWHVNAFGGADSSNNLDSDVTTPERLGMKDVNAKGLDHPPSLLPNYRAERPKRNCALKRLPNYVEYYEPFEHIKSKRPLKKQKVTTLKEPSPKKPIASGATPNISSTNNDDDDNNNNNTNTDYEDNGIAHSIDAPVSLSVEQPILPQSNSNPTIALRPSPEGAISPSEIGIPASINQRKPKGPLSRSKSKATTPNLKKYSLNINDFPEPNKIPNTYFQQHGIKWWNGVFLFFGVNRSYDEYTNRFPLSDAEAQWFWFCLLHLKISIESEEEEEEEKSLLYFGRLFLTEKVFDWLPSFYRERHSNKCWESLKDCFDLEYTKLNDGDIPPFFALFTDSGYERPISKSDLIIYLKVFCNIPHDLSFSLTSD